MNGPILALNPNVPYSKITVVADWCNEHEYNHYQLLYAAAVQVLEGLLCQCNQEKMEALGAALYQVAPTDKHRFLAVTLALKSLISTYRLRMMWLSEYTITNPAVPVDEINRLALTCRQKGLEPVELLDVALCRASVEEVISGESDDGETAQINCDLLTGAADAGKIIGQELGDRPMEDRVGMLLRITRAMCGNLLGNCSKAS